jgi:HTH-type transcriptional regulator / antitoxin HigA
MEAMMNRTTVAELTTHFHAITSIVPLHTLHDEEDYDKAVAVLNQLLDMGAGEPNAPLVDLVNTLSALIAEYDELHYPQQPVAPVEVLRFLMEQHQLPQSSLPEIGSQGVVSEILSGKRELNVRQIRALAERFHVPPAAFI